MTRSSLSLDLEKLSWPLGRLDEAIEWLARKSGLSGCAVDIPSVPTSAKNPEALSEWLTAAAIALAVEIEMVESSYAEADALVRNCGPALLQVRIGSEARFLAVLRSRMPGVDLLSPTLVLHRVQPCALRATLCRELEAPRIAETEELLERAAVPARKRPAALAAILREQLASVRLSPCWLLRLTPGGGILQLAREAQIPSRLLALVSAHTAQYLLWLLSWWIIGQTALQGRFDWGWLAAWALALFAMIPVRLLGTWWQGMLSVRIGALLKRRLLFAALQLQLEEVRHHGAGQLLGCVIESEAVESLALTGGFMALLAGLELAFAAVVMTFGPAGALHVLLLVGWIGLALSIAWRCSRNREWWTQSRLKLTNELVEQMVGHRTRLAQEARERWHQGEDQSLSGLMTLAIGMDRPAMWLTALVPRGWLLLGLLALAPSFTLATASPIELAVGLGGVLLGFRAFQRFAAGLAHIAGAAIAWKQVVPFFRAATRPRDLGASVAATGPSAKSCASEESQVLIEAHDLTFCYRDRGLPVLRDCSLSIRPGERILLEGPSGGGKSTFASMLAGLRVPDSGLLLLRGLDRQTVGLNRWRRSVAAAPQFHENHVMTGTFAFNLLMGGQWPPQPEVLLQAQTLCHELGLEDLLKRMPAGLLQLVGEGGWQLSHGERSRLYIARALLQGAELVVLDESFASLDPESLRLTLGCVLGRAKTLLVIAHP